MSYLSPLAASLVPYVPGEQPRGRKLIKLNTNENAFPPSPRVAEAIRAAGEGGAPFDALRLYPDPTCLALRESIAALHGVSADWVFVGNGSDEVLAFAFAAFFAQGRVAMPELGYSFYPVYAKLFQAEPLLGPVDEALIVDAEALLSLDAPVILANPNAPTSRAVPKETVLDMARRLRARGQVCIVDEAYADFGRCSVLDACRELDNLLVVRTLSKSHALAGLRVGYAVGHPGLIDGLTRIKDSFNSYTLDALALAGAKAALEDHAYARARIAEICRVRDWTREALLALGMEVPPSETNFLFARHPKASGKALFDALRAHDILVRHFDTPRLREYLRISVGTEAQMRMVTETLQTLLAEMGCLP